MPKVPLVQPKVKTVTSSLSALSLSALGVVFGDIGTSPLYTLKTVLNLTGGNPDPTATLGALSLVIWTLIIVTSIKYVSFAMRIDNDGEGGILALMSLLGVKRQHRPAIVALGLFGAALIYGDGAITPAISVLSALEGLDIVTSTFRPYILPAAVVILIALFAIQPMGTTKIGKAFGPIMALWFLVMVMLGLWGIVQHPAVLFAIDPRAGLTYLRTGGLTGFLVLGGVFLCVTGAEALYADMGHFGARPIRLAWSALVFPSLVLNYAGQAALVLEGAPTANNIFYRAVSAGNARATGAACDDRHDHRKSVDYHRRLLDDAAGDPARMDAALAHRTDVRTRIWSNLRRRRQLAIDARDARPDDRFWQVGQSGGGLRHSGLGHDADDYGASLHRDAGDLALDSTCGCCRCRRFLHRRCHLPRRQPRQDRRRRLRAVAARRRGVRCNVGLARRRAGSLGTSPRIRCTDRKLHGVDRGGKKPRACQVPPCSSPARITTFRR